jgi:hypothetical protein
MCNLFVQIYFVATCFLKTEKSSLELLAKGGYKISANDQGLLPAVEFKDFSGRAHHKFIFI